MECQTQEIISKNSFYNQMSRTTLIDLRKAAFVDEDCEIMQDVLGGVNSQKSTFDKLQKIAYGICGYARWLSFIVSQKWIVQANGTLQEQIQSASMGTSIPPLNSEVEHEAITSLVRIVLARFRPYELERFKRLCDVLEIQVPDRVKERVEGWRAMF